jgi:hypothetical protein
MFTKPKGGLNAAVIYRGPSVLDGSPIVVIATPSSSNRKTGGMLQTWIIRADVDPITANRTGTDSAICGDCPLRGLADPYKEKGTANFRGCYVALHQAPLSVFKTFQRGRYPELKPDELTDYGASQNIRLGAYGDPAAVPVWVWVRLLKACDGWTGYTHQKDHTKTLAKFCMSSADTIDEAQKEWAAGRRTFRIVPNPMSIDPKNEVICPATKEGGQRTTCDQCGLCMGEHPTARSIAAVVHGAGAKHAASMIIARAV